MTTDTDPPDTDPPDAREGTERALDRGRLATWLHEQALLERPDELVIEPISGGNQNMVARLHGCRQAMVLRRPAPIVPRGRNAMMQREFRVLTALEGTAVPHATPLAICTDEEILGATFYVMSEIDGWSPAATSSWPSPYGLDGDPAARRQLAVELVRGLAELAAVDWRAQGLAGFGKPTDFHQRQVDRWSAHWETFRFRPLNGIDEAGRWLRENLPTRWTPGLMHGDYSFLNVMFAHGPQPRLAAIVDWEMTTIGDPVLDLAWLARQWPAAGEGIRTRYVDYTGLPDQQELIDIYRGLTGNPVEHYHYYEVLANFKLAIVLEGGYARFLQGQVDNPKVAHYDEAIQRANRAAAALVASG